MRKVLILTDMTSLELAKAVLLTYMSDASKFIGKLLILRPSKEVADFSLSLQPSGYEEVGEGLKAQWQAITAIYKDGYEPFLLPHVFPEDTFDLLVAVDSLAAETCLAGREPGTSVKAIILRSAPQSIVSFNVRAGKDSPSITTRFLREAVYSDKAARVDTVFVASEADSAALSNNFEFINSVVPVETIEFPIINSPRRAQEAVRSTLSLPDGSTLKPEDKVICVKLPTSQDMGLHQPNIAGLLELIFELSCVSGKTTQPRWLILCGSPGFRQAIKNGSMPPAVTSNVVFMGRGDTDTFFDSDALVTALSASDVVVDVDRDHGYDIFLETALSWGMPVISCTQGNANIKTHRTNLLGSTLDLDTTVRALRAITTGTWPSDKPFKRTLNHNLLRMLEND
jgi:hypothetical protein